MEMFIDYISQGILGIKTPKWIEVDELHTKTQLAEANIDEYIIYTKKNIVDEKMLYFVIAHELRHMWQAIHKKEWIKNFEIPKGEIKNYNEQEAEIDANAFAAAIMMSMFGIKPLFYSLEESTRNKIYDNAEKILKEITIE